MLGYDWPRLHALLNDLPIALLVTAVFFDLMALATRRVVFRQVSFSLLMVGVLGAVAAVVSGLQAEEHIDHGEAVHRVMETHERFALITLGVFGVLALWRLVREKRMASAERTLVVILSLAGTGVLFATGLFGGRLVFEHAAGIPSPVLQEELHERSEGHHHNAGLTGGHEADSASGHVDPPGSAPHTHSHPPGTPPHQD
ncbi:MAG: DUF2231 domain-containing protein [Gemmatimonadales bacterium]